MKSLKYFLFSFIAISFLFSSQVFAEKTSLLPSKNEETKTRVESNIDTVATINIKNAQILSAKYSDFILSFDITNREGVQNDLKYGVKLIGENNTGQFIVDEQVYPEILKIEENVSIHKEIKYTAPSNIGGKYTIYITAKNTTGFPFGSIPAGEVNIEPSTTGVIIIPESCFISVQNEISNKKYSLSEGVDISKLENIVLNCEVLNSSVKEISITPSYETKYRSAYGEVVATEGGTIEPISFKPSENKKVSVVLPKAKIAQSYSVKFSLLSESSASNSIIIQYVLSGESGTIQNLSLDRNYYKKGDTAIISFLSSGRADVFPGNRSGMDSYPSNNIEIDILNNKGQKCINQIKQEAVSGKTDLPSSVIINCNNPTINLVLKDNLGNILDKKSVSYEKELNIKDIITSPLSIGIISLIILLIIFLFIKKRKNKIALSSKKIISVLFFLLVSSFISPNIVNASTYTLGDINGIQAMFAINGIDIHYDLNATISLYGEVVVSSCNNATPEAEAFVTYNGEKKYLLTNATISGSTTKSLSGVEFKTGGEIKEKDSMVLTLKFNGTESNTVIYFRVGGNRERAICSNTIINDHYKCSEGYPKDLKENDTSWKWDCVSNDNILSSSCTANKIPVDGMCNPSYTGYGGPSSRQECSSGSVIERNNNTWKCKGLYGGKTSNICNEKKSSLCGTTLYSCSEEAKEDSSYRKLNYDDSVTWLCSPKAGGSGEWCNAKLGISDKEDSDIWARIDGECRIPLEDNKCDLKASWEFVGNMSEYKICYTDDSTNVTECKTKNERNGLETMIGNLQYGKNITVSIRSMSDKVLASDKVLSDCTSNYSFSNADIGVVWNANKNRCVRNGGWNDGYPTSSCVVDCKGKEYMAQVTGSQYFDRSCTNPEPSLSGTTCGGETTIKKSCSAFCREDNGGPSDITITGPSQFNTGEAQAFTFKATDPNDELVRYGINWAYRVFGSVNEASLAYNLGKYYDFYDPNDGYIIGNWLPTNTDNNTSLHYTKSGSTQSSSHVWNNPGVYAFRAIVQNYKGNFSKNWVQKLVTVYANRWAEIKASPSTIDKNNGFTLSWDSGYTKKCTIKNVDTDSILNLKSICQQKFYYTLTNGSSYEVESQDPSTDICTLGSISLTTGETTKYSITCEPNDLSRDKTYVTKYVTVNVLDIDENSKITVNLLPNSNDANAKISEGKSVKLSWTSENATSCGLTVGDSKDVINNLQKPDDDFTVNPTVNTTYKITCINEWNEATDSSLITVTPKDGGDGTGGDGDGATPNNPKGIKYKEN